MAADRYLHTYLNDHLAGSLLGLEIARRAAGHNRDTTTGRVLAEVATEILEDRRTLQRVMARLGAGRDRLKLLAAWGAERASRLKRNGELLGYSPLARLEEIELLTLGVEGKLLLWRALRTGWSGDPRLRGIDLDDLIKRASSQRRRLERQRLKAVEELA
jgi:hypothetical protein